MNKISSQALSDSLTETEDLVVIDVLPEESFERNHIPGALNACVYEIDFLQNVASLVDDENQRIVLYGEDDRFEAAALAQSKLIQDGWKDVSVLQNGISEWIQSGFPIEGNGIEPAPHSGTFNVDQEKSVVRWIGRNLLNQHNGTIAIKQASIVLENGALKSGEATIDMTLMECEDIHDPNLCQILIDHLSTDDFFLVDEYPTARFIVTSTHPIDKAQPGSPNYLVEGTFTLRGHTEPLSFPATLGIDENTIALQAHFDFDRVLWNSKYGSGKIYEALGKHLVNDFISISFQLLAPLTK